MVNLSSVKSAFLPLDFGGLEALSGYPKNVEEIFAIFGSTDLHSFVKVQNICYQGSSFSFSASFLSIRASVPFAPLFFSLPRERDPNSPEIREGKRQKKKEPSTCLSHFFSAVL